MKESNTIEVCKSVHFEGSGETIIISIKLNNVSPDRVKLFSRSLDIIFGELKDLFLG